MIKEISEQFETSDGHRFLTKTEASEHEEFILTNNQFESSRRRLLIYLARRTRTADGEIFVPSEYFHLSNLRNGPQLERVWINLYSLEFDSYTPDQCDIRARSDNGQHSYRIDKLYKSHMKAIEALLKAREAWALEYEAENQRLREHIKNQ